MDKNKLKILKAIVAQEYPELLPLIQGNESESLLEKMTMIKGQPGEDGYTPKKGVDYFTQAEIQQFIDYVTPQKGVDYFDGKDGIDGRDGKDAKDGRNGRDGIDGRDGRDGKDYDPKTIESVTKKLNDLIKNIPDLEEFAKEFKRGGKHQLKLNDVAGAPLDMRWHGGGISEVIHDDTLTGNGTIGDPLSVIGGVEGVDSVTGLNTDNSDPRNPIVEISVDGMTITGQGTPGDPLVASTSGFSGTPESVVFVGADTFLTEDNANFRYDQSIPQLQLGIVDSTYFYPEAIVTAVGNYGSPGVADFFGFNIRNQSPQGSSDYILANDLDDGSLTGIYGDFGIAGSQYVPTGIGDDLIQAGDVYLYASVSAGNVDISTINPGKKIRFATAGSSLNELRMEIADGTTSVYANKDPDITPAFTGGNWTGTNGWSVSGSDLVKVSDPAIGTIQPATPLTIAVSTTYKVTIIASGISGAITYVLGGVDGDAITDGTTISYITALDTSNLIISGAISSTATITSITIQPLIDNTGDVLIEGNLIMGSQLRTIGGEAVMNIAGDGVATFEMLPFGPNGVTPTEDYQLVPKIYVDTFINGARFVAAVNAATTTALPAVNYANGSSGVGATLTGNVNGAFPTVDGVAAVLNNTYLIKDQAAGLQNGAYKLTTLGDGSNPFVLTRLTMYDTSAEIVTGTFFTILGGTVNIRSQWALTTTGTVTVGSTALTFEQLSAPIQYTGGDGISVTGTVIDMDLASTPGLEFVTGQVRVFTDESSIERSASGIRVKALGVTNGMLAGSIADTKLNTITTAGKVSGTSFTQLQNTPSGAGIIPIPNLASGTPTGLKFIRDDGVLAVPAGGGTVQSVTGLNTNNADPVNPVVRISTGTGLSGLGTPGSPLVATNTGTVTSVTGLNTNNTDPANPIVRVSVDGSTITGSGTPADPLVSVGGSGGSGVSLITVSGTIDDSNLTFTASEEPVLLVVNGQSFKKTGGSTTWSYSLGTITISTPVGTGGSIFGEKGGTPNGSVVSAGATIDGGGITITTGSKGYISFPYNGTVTAWTILGDQTGSIVVDIKKCTYGAFPTTSSIAGTEKPTLSSAQKNQDVSLTTWSTTITQGDIWECVVDSATTVTRVNLFFSITRS